MKQQISEKSLIEALKEHDTKRWQWDTIDCCLTGKNADLDGGEVGIEFVSIEGGRAIFVVHIGATFVGNDVSLNVSEEVDLDPDLYRKAVDEYLDQAYHVICGIGIPGDWSGDDWYLHQDLEASVPIKDTPEETAASIVEEAWRVADPTLKELEYAGDILEELAGWKKKETEPS